MNQQTNSGAGDLVRGEIKPKSTTPQTDAVEGELLAEYGYCEAAFNNMANHARDLEREKAELVKVLKQSVDADKKLRETRINADGWAQSLKYLNDAEDARAAALAKAGAA